MNRKYRISIVWKLTLWYTVFLSLLAMLIVAVTYLVSGRIIQNFTKSSLVNAISEVEEEIEYEDGELELEDEIQFLNQGVYISIYDRENELLMGIYPKSFDYHQTFLENQIQTIQIEHVKWFLYERTITVSGYGKVTIRGLVLETADTQNVRVMNLVLLCLSPVIILIATFGGHALTKQAFRPIHKMREIVEQINGGRDLSKRVNIMKGEEEIYQLGQTFDRMFERLEEAFEREKQFTSDVSHELRTPVSVILSQCEYAMDQENCEETQEALESIFKQTGKMSKLIAQLLVLARDDAGFEKLSIEEINLSELLEAVVEEAFERAKTKRITINSEIDAFVMIEGDEIMLMRFFHNLLMNAIKYGRDGGWVKVCLHKTDTGVKGFIQDNGIGIAKEEQEKVWHRFYQVNPSRTSCEDGNLGLGLSMVKWIAKAHQGDVYVESEIGVGSTFHFAFPIKMKR